MQLLKYPTACLFFLTWFRCSGLRGVPDHHNKMACAAGLHSMPNLSPDADRRAPDDFRVSWLTSASKKPIVLEAVREWSPLGVDRFYQLIRDNYFDCAAFFRVAPGFVVQLGIASKPRLTAKWNTEIPDDPVVKSNLYSYMSFATAGPNTRTAQIFINFSDNPSLDARGFSPFARVVSGMDVVEKLYNPTPDLATGLDQMAIRLQGNNWILSEYPQVDLILATTLSKAVHHADPVMAAWITPTAVLATLLLGAVFFSHRIRAIRRRFTTNGMPGSYRNIQQLPP